MAFSSSRNHVAALSGSSLLVLSEIGWIALRVLSRKLRCIKGSPNAFFKVAQALSIEVVQSEGMWSAAFPVRAPQSLSSWSVFEILLFLIALLNLSLKVMKSSLGLPEYVGIYCGQGLAD